MIGLITWLQQIAKTESWDSLPSTSFPKKSILGTKCCSKAISTLLSSVQRHYIQTSDTRLKTDQEHETGIDFDGPFGSFWKLDVPYISSVPPCFPDILRAKQLEGVLLEAESSFMSDLGRKKPLSTASGKVSSPCAPGAPGTSPKRTDFEPLGTRWKSKMCKMCSCTMEKYWKREEWSSKPQIIWLLGTNLPSPFSFRSPGHASLTFCNRLGSRGDALEGVTCRRGRAEVLLIVTTHNGNMYHIYQPTNRISWHGVWFVRVLMILPLKNVEYKAVL